MAVFKSGSEASFSRSVQDLPLVLCGPMLRKVARDSVTVFLALKDQCSVQLVIYKDPTGQQVHAHGEVAETIALGKHLHLLVVTVELPVEKYLDEGVLYGYDLVVRGAGLPAEGLSLQNDPSHRLFEEDPLAAGPNALSYTPGQLPSFTLAARDVKDLRLFHGSCRKPHGEGLDMLAKLDDLLRAYHGDIERRPQLLMLTGDQIYADDVSPLLLRCFHDSMIALLGWRETVPALHFRLPRVLSGLTPQALKELNSDELASDGSWHHTRWSPGVSIDEADLRSLTDLSRASRIAPPQRGKEVLRSALFSTSEPDSHLIFFGEFLLMYLYTWSDTLWWREAGQLSLPDYNDAVPAFSLFGDHSRASLTEQRARVLRFGQSLGKVRRALANIATFMIFDDHEVTDDWNLNQSWVTRVNNSEMGPRILRNALVAYALCQDWGSRPGYYRNGAHGQAILDACRDTGGTPPKLVTQPDGLDALLGVGPVHCKTEPQIVWNYTIAPHGDATGYRIHVLDTRTRRDFPSQTLVDQTIEAMKQWIGDYTPFAGLVLNPGLLSENALAAQLVIDPAVVNIIVSPAPVFGSALVEKVVQRAKTCVDGPEELDCETWSGDDTAFRRLIAALKQATSGAVVLSGDVHYAFSHRIEFSGAGSAAAVQLCASSLKNETSTTILGGAENPLQKLRFVDTGHDLAKYIEDTINANLSAKIANGSDLVSGERDNGGSLSFWDPAGIALKLCDLNPYRLPRPHLLPMHLLFGAYAADGVVQYLDLEPRLAKPDQFSVVCVSDLADDAARSQRIAALNPGNAAPETAWKFSRHEARKVVGYNNLGEVSFTREGRLTRVIHRLYWPVHDETRASYDALMVTVHTADLSSK